MQKVFPYNYVMGLLPDTLNSICACAGNAGTVSPSPQVNDPDMHHGTCVTHAPWCTPGSLLAVSFEIGGGWKRSRHSRRMRNLQFYVSGKRPIIRYSPTHDIVHPNITTSTPKLGEYQRDATGESHLTADNDSVLLTAVIITHCTPLVVMVDFQTTLMCDTTNQSDAWNWDSSTHCRFVLP